MAYEFYEYDGRVVMGYALKRKPLRPKQKGHHTGVLILFRTISNLHRILERD